MVATKVCTKCRLEKSLNDDFSKHPHTKDGRASWCRTCFGGWQKGYAKARRHNPKTRAVVLAKDKQGNDKKTPRMNANYRLKQKYGIGLEEKELVLKLQNGECKCCGSLSPKSKKGWVLDHNHTTGELRGVLCHPCNLILGMVNESKDHLHKLIVYLEAGHKLKVKAATI